jgi:hypothetical protein
MKVQSATFSADENYGADFGCSDKWPLTLHLTSAISSGTDWANKPANGANDQSSTLQVHPGPNPNSSCTRQAVSYNVTYAMVIAAAHSFSDTTFGLYGDETASSTNYGFMRIGVNPSIITTFDLVPPVPATSSLATTPAPQDTPSGAADYGCSPSGNYGWISQTSLALTAEIKAYISQEYVRAIYHMTDSKNSGASVSPVPGPSNWYSNADGTTHTGIGFALKNGHQYGWTAEANVDGSNPGSGGGTDGSNTAGYTSAQSAQCHFNVDLSAPSQPTVTSTGFPPSGSGQPGLTAGQAGTFTFTSADPLPGGCTPAPCLASDVAWFEYSLNTQIPVSGAAHVAAGANSNGSTATGSLSLTIGSWGTNTLYVAAVDNAGNVTQAFQYTFYAPWNPSAKVTAGDVNGDGIPDLLGTSSNLVLYPGNIDPASTPVTAGTLASSPDGPPGVPFRSPIAGRSPARAWMTCSRTRAAIWSSTLTTPGNQGVAPQFNAVGNSTTLSSHPACAATADNVNNCSGYVTGTWSDVTQILAVGDARTGSPSDNGLPSLLAVENGQLWLSQGQFGKTLAGPIQLGSSAGTTNWSGMTLIAPGTVAGQLTIWARNNATGAIYSYPVTIDANGLPTMNPASPGTPVSATSGPVITGLTLSASTYPALASPGALDNSSFPGLYAEATSGTTPAGGSCATGCLWYYPGQSTTGGAQPITGTPVFVGVLAAPVTQLS